MKINPDLYRLNAVELAPRLLGVKLCRRLDDKIIKGIANVAYMAAIFTNSKN